MNRQGPGPGSTSTEARAIPTKGAAVAQALRVARAAQQAAFLAHP
eukprot:CAMPEP_0202061604 /NCGR_PEP_ID=MMETSP0963-20130614/41662_1 /ASSEMBLY_ACC=CAM_ASM_000494 /TAXON_ID=4773 /ORGANISM="Schizochytrium aggregatum, Strain ATCC28209" /LENGTH=44 /DNA_ID= /DNA_START= /DNA_END= /DNA_ORIENTATION=